MRIYGANRVPFQEGIKEIAADSIEEALQYNLEMWAESGRERPLSVGVICKATGKVLDSVIDPVTGEEKIVGGKVGRNWKGAPKIRLDKGHPLMSLKEFVVTPGPESQPGYKMLGTTLEEALDGLKAIWEESGKKRPQCLRVWSPAFDETLDSVICGDSGEERMFYGIAEMKKNGITWNPDDKKNKKLGLYNLAIEEIVAKSIEG